MGNRASYTPTAHTRISHFGSIALIAVVIAAALCAVVAAKYVQNASRVAPATADEFYFESDVLDGQTHEVVATEGADGGKMATVTVTLKNHADDLRFSGVDIPYTVSVEPNEGVAVTPSSGTLAKGSVRDATATISGLQAGKTYSISASTDSTYSKTLTGAFRVSPNDTAIKTSLRDSGAYIEAVIWTADYSGSVSVSYPSGLIPDNTDSKMAGWKTAAEGSTAQTSNLDTYESHAFRFFKSETSKTYAISASGQTVTIAEANQ